MKLFWKRNYRKKQKKTIKYIGNNVIQGNLPANKANVSNKK